MSEVPDMWALEQAKGPNTPSKRLSCGECVIVSRLDLPSEMIAFVCLASECYLVTWALAFKTAAVAKNPSEGEAAAEGCEQLFHLISPQSGPGVMVSAIYQFLLPSEATVPETATKTFWKNGHRVLSLPCFKLQ